MDIMSCVRFLGKDLGLSEFDITYTLNRVRCEGFSFLSKTLPKFVKSVLYALEKGSFSYYDFTGFRRRGLFPDFLRCKLERIFDSSGFPLVSEASAQALKEIRCFCEYFYKTVITDVDSPPTDQFCEEDRVLDDTLDIPFLEQLRRDFATYFRKIHDSTVDHVLTVCPPRFGPGTFSGKNNYPYPWHLRKFSKVGPHKDFRSYGWACSTKAFGVRYTQPFETEPDVRFNELLFVPKDSRGPRAIVREPASLLRFQMSFNDFMRSRLEQDSYYRVNFASQETNRRLAMHSSVSKEWSTLDLEHGSDRTSFRAMRILFRNSPLKKFIMTSTRTCHLPDRSPIQLKKLAGMGSGLTFPCMSLLIYLSIVRSISNHGIPYKVAQRLVYVYGDDIVVPRRFHEIAISGLSRVGYRVNSSKSYANSHFRESCGADYYNGYDVSPVRLKLANAGLVYRRGCLYFKDKAFYLLQLERHCRELVKIGFVNLSRYYYMILERFLGTLPYGSGTTPYLVRYRLDPTEIKLRCDSTGTHLNTSVFEVVPVRMRWENYQHILDIPRILRCTLNRYSASSFDPLSKIESSSAWEDSVGVVPRSARLRKVEIPCVSLLG